MPLGIGDIQRAFRPILAKASESEGKGCLKVDGAIGFSDDEIAQMEAQQEDRWLAEELREEQEIGREMM